MGKRDIPTHFPKKVFSPGSFLKQQKVPNETFGTVRQRSFDRKTCYPPRIHKLVSLPEVFWSNEEFPKENLETVTEENFDRKYDIPFSHPYKPSTARNFLKHRRVPNESFR